MFISGQCWYFILKPLSADSNDAPISSRIRSWVGFVTTGQEACEKETVAPFHFAEYKMVHFSVSGHKWVSNFKLCKAKQYPTRLNMYNNWGGKKVSTYTFSDKNGSTLSFLGFFPAYIKWTSPVDLTSTLTLQPSLASLEYMLDQCAVISQSQAPICLIKLRQPNQGLLDKT